MRGKGLVISFNWIFVLIAGGLILAFFYSLARTHIETSTVKTARKVVSNFKIVLKTALASPKTVKKVKIPDFGISFYCRDNTSYYSVKGVSQDSDLDVIFSLKNFKHETILLVVEPWILGFQVTNFGLITSKAHAFIFLNLTPEMALLKAELPEELPVFVYNQSSINSSELPKGFDFYTIIAQQPSGVSLTPGGLAEPRENVKLLVFDPSPDFFNGTVMFYKGSKFNAWIGQGSSGFVGLPMAMGALFSQDKQFYDCNVRKALKHLQVVASVYSKKVWLMTSSTPFSSDCSLIYSMTSGFAGILNDLKTFTQANELLTPTNQGDLASIAKTLTFTNQVAVGSACPPLY